MRSRTMSSWLSLSQILTLIALFSSSRAASNDSAPTLPGGYPPYVPTYMRSNVNNQFGTAPDKGLFDGPVLGLLNSSVLAKLSSGTIGNLVPNIQLLNDTSILSGPSSSSSLNSSASILNTTLNGRSILDSAWDASERALYVEARRNLLLGDTLLDQAFWDTEEQILTRDLRWPGDDPDNSDAPSGGYMLAPKIMERSSSDSYWLDNVPHGNMPLAPSNYTFFRSVKDFGAMGDGQTDDTAAINMAASVGPRCGNNCGSTTTLGALVYFPPGTYVVSSPIIQYFYTQFVGDPISPPTLQSTYNFTGIAIIDSDVYIPGGNGAEWYINQNNFYRQIRNINFDMTHQASINQQDGQQYVPTGIHWQVGQATSITNCVFNMNTSQPSDPNGRATAVGIFMENGSGGFMADLTFNGGGTGMIVGSQQFTFRNLVFSECLIGVSILWNWGMTFQNCKFFLNYIAFNCTVHGGSTGQGAGSLSVLDSSFSYVPTPIVIDAQAPNPNLILENLEVDNSQAIVQVNGGSTLLAGYSGSTYVKSWGMGGAYLDETGKRQFLTGDISPYPNVSPSLLNDQNQWFTQSKPLYTSTASSDIVVATQNGVSNLMTGDQSSAINSLLAQNIGKVIFFPAGIYLVANTVFVPKGSIIVGEGWSQIMATGSNFADPVNPLVMVRVGNLGDQGSVQIQDMLFTVQGSTAGCVLMEWNIAQSSQGSAAMWDSHFRVGGAQGSDLQYADCNSGPNSNCYAASLMLHLTNQLSGYFENIWLWVADHDLDNTNNQYAFETNDGIPRDVTTQIKVYGGRGVLIESQSGPVWFWGTASEHSELYNFQLSNTTNVFMSHIQTETPYYQPEQNWELLVYSPGEGGFKNDPTFSDCSASNCVSSWALRMINSTNIYIYSMGFYSFFQNLNLGCGNAQSCQERIIQTDYVGNAFLYNIFTYGSEEIISPAGGFPPPVYFNDSNQDGYTSEVAAWLALASSDAGNLGDGGQSGSSIGSGVVYIGGQIWSEPQDNRTVDCLPPCTFVFPPITLPTPTTITFPPWTTTLEVGWTTSSTITSGTITVVTTFYTTISESTVLQVPPVTTSIIDIWNTGIPDNVTSTIIYGTSSVLPPPFIITDNPNPLSESGVSHPPRNRTIYPPPWPWPSSVYLTTETTNGVTSTKYTTQATSHDTSIPPITYNSGKPKPTCSSGCGNQCHFWCNRCLPLLPPSLGGCTGSDFCTLNCPPGTHSGSDGTYENGDDDDDGNDDGDDDCTTTTASQCYTYQIGTTSVATSCETFVACSATNEEISATETPAQVGFEEDTPNPDYDTSDDPSDYAVYGSIYTNLVTAGLWDTQTYTSYPDVTAAPSSPAPTAAPTYVSCSTQNQDPDQGIDTAYCVCGGSTVPISTSGSVSCAYTSQPTNTISISTQVETITFSDQCQVCTIYGDGNAGSECTSISGCTTVTATTSPTSTVAPPAAPSNANFGIFNERIYEVECDGNDHCRSNLDDVYVAAIPFSGLCYQSKGDYDQGFDPNTGDYAEGLQNPTDFKEGLCGSGPFSCSQASSSEWDCHFSNGSVAATCGVDTSGEKWATCNTIEGDTILDLKLYCSPLGFACP